MKKLLLLLPFLFSISAAYSQGCSDAGFCTIEAFKTHEAEDSITAETKPLDVFKIGSTFGQGQSGVIIINPYLEYTTHLNNNVVANAKLISAIHSGGITTKGMLSDVLVSLSYKTNKKLMIVGGAKLPFTSSNEKYKGEILPMGYQSSLGTLDAILGARYVYRSLAFTFAYQQPLTQNKNTFVLSESSFNNISNLYDTKGYHRAGDILLRISNNWKSNKHSFTLSALPIYHLQNDTYLNNLNERVEHVNSQGLTLNANMFYRYNISNITAVELSIGGPAIARKSRPDGLSQFSIGIELIKKL